MFTTATRGSSLKDLFKSSLSSMFSSNAVKHLMLVLFIILFIINIIGNVPLNSIPSIFYRVTLTISLMFWIPLIVCTSIADIKEFLAHMLPYDCPVPLIFILPLIELFSQLIRPFTLIVRLRTNLSAGHIIIYLFSYFTLLSDTLAPFIYLVLCGLFVLELCISMLQAYIFVALLALYVNETV